MIARLSYEIDTTRVCAHDSSVSVFKNKNFKKGSAPFSAAAQMIVQEGDLSTANMNSLPTLCAGAQARQDHGPPDLQRDRAPRTHPEVSEWGQTFLYELIRAPQTHASPARIFLACLYVKLTD